MIPRAVVVLVMLAAASAGCTQRECACREAPMGTTTTTTEGGDGADSQPEPEPIDRESEARVLPERPDLAALRACGELADAVCVVRVLEGKLLTAAEMGLLVEVYRRLGLQRRARAYMGMYVERFPVGDRADLYRQHLAFEPSY